MSEFNQRIPQPGEDFRAADRLEIMDLMWRFVAGLDIGDIGMFEACFAERVLCDLSDNPVRWTGHVIDLLPQELDRSDLVQIVLGRDAGNLALPDTAVSPIRIFVQHGVLNPLVTFTGEESATVLAYNHEHFHMWLEEGENEQTSSQDIGGFYHNDVVKIGDRWRISALRLKIRYYDPSTLFAQHMKRAPAERSAPRPSSVGVPALQKVSRP